MPNAAASVSGIFQLLQDFTTVGKRSVVATASLDDVDAQTRCNLNAEMFIGDEANTTRVGFKTQYAHISGAVALCHDRASNALSFDVRGASIDTITTVLPEDAEKDVDDTVRPDTIHAFTAYSYALHTFSILGTVTTVLGEPDSPDHQFTINTECWNRQTKSPDSWTAVIHFPHTRRWKNTPSPTPNTVVHVDATWMYNSLASPPGPAAHFSLNHLDFINATYHAASTAAHAPKRRRKMGDSSSSQPAVPDHHTQQQPSSPPGGSVTEKEDDLYAST